MPFLKGKFRNYVVENVEKEEDQSVNKDGNKESKKNGEELLDIDGVSDEGSTQHGRAKLDTEEGETSEEIEEELEEVYDEELKIQELSTSDNKRKDIQLDFLNNLGDTDIIGDASPNHKQNEKEEQISYSSVSEKPKRKDDHHGKRDSKPRSRHEDNINIDQNSRKEPVHFHSEREKKYDNSNKGSASPSKLNTREQAHNINQAHYFEQSRRGNNQERGRRGRTPHSQNIRERIDSRYPTYSRPQLDYIPHDYNRDRLHDYSMIEAERYRGVPRSVYSNDKFPEGEPWPIDEKNFREDYHNSVRVPPPMSCDDNRRYDQMSLPHRNYNYKRDEIRSGERRDQPYFFLENNEMYPQERNNWSENRRDYFLPHEMKRYPEKYPREVGPSPKKRNKDIQVDYGSNLSNPILAAEMADGTLRQSMNQDMRQLRARWNAPDNRRKQPRNPPIDFDQRLERKPKFMEEPPHNISNSYPRPYDTLLNHTNTHLPTKNYPYQKSSHEDPYVEQPSSNHLGFENSVGNLPRRSLTNYIEHEEVHPRKRPNVGQQYYSRPPNLPIPVPIFIENNDDVKIPFPDQKEPPSGRVAEHEDQKEKISRDETNYNTRSQLGSSKHTPPVQQQNVDMSIKNIRREENKAPSRSEANNYDNRRKPSNIREEIRRDPKNYGVTPIEREIPTKSENTENNRISEKDTVHRALNKRNSKNEHKTEKSGLEFYKQAPSIGDQVKIITKATPPKEVEKSQYSATISTDKINSDHMNSDLIVKKPQVPSQVKRIKIYRSSPFESSVNANSRMLPQSDTKETEKLKTSPSQQLPVSDLSEKRLVLTSKDVINLREPKSNHPQRKSSIEKTSVPVSKVEHASEIPPDNLVRKEKGDMPMTELPKPRFISLLAVKSETRVPNQQYVQPSNTSLKSNEGSNVITRIEFKGKSNSPVKDDQQIIRFKKNFHRPLGFMSNKSDQQVELEENPPQKKQKIFNDNKKSKCYDWAYKGICKRGSNCKYLHETQSETFFSNNSGVYDGTNLKKTINIGKNKRGRYQQSFSD